jgi:hypothetical protein
MTMNERRARSRAGWTRAARLLGTALLAGAVGCGDDATDGAAACVPDLCGSSFVCEFRDDEGNLETTVDVEFVESANGCSVIPGNLVYTCENLITSGGERRGTWTVQGDGYEACIDAEFGGGCAVCSPR